MRAITSCSDITYNEEDGYEIKRPNGTIMVYCTVGAEYRRTYIPATRWDPEDDERERTGELSVAISMVTDEDGNPIVGWITPEEEKEFNDYMSQKLDEEADEYDWEN